METTGFPVNLVSFLQGGEVSRFGILGWRLAVNMGDGLGELQPLIPFQDKFLPGKGC